MGTFIDSIRLRLKQKDILIQLIAINICVFLLLAVINLVSVLFELSSLNLLQYIGLSSDIPYMWKHSWTLVTYMFVNEGVLHILLNMLLLYWFGQIFLTYFSPKNLGSLYILGGLAGAVLYILAFNTIPYYVNMGHPLMIGASASVMAIIFGAALYNPNYSINLLLFGRVKIIYIAIFLFLLDFVNLGDKTNPGGHVAHIGGAILGYLFASQYRKGHDITRWINGIIDGIANLFKSRPPKMKVKYNTGKKPETDYQYNARKHRESDEIDQILDKIKASGYSSLTENEKKHLFDASKK